VLHILSGVRVRATPSESEPGVACSLPYVSLFLGFLPLFCCFLGSAHHVKRQHRHSFLAPSPIYAAEIHSDPHHQTWHPTVYVGKRCKDQQMRLETRPSNELSIAFFSKTAPTLSPCHDMLTSCYQAFLAVDHRAIKLCCARQ
jgi:hypothetical protein